jgi:hypothetical protein
MRETYAISTLEPHTAALEPDADPRDNDPAFGNDEDHANSTASLTGSILKCREENGETYHPYRELSSF